MWSVEVTPVAKSVCWNEDLGDDKMTEAGAYRIAIGVTVFTSNRMNRAHNSFYSVGTYFTSKTNRATERNGDCDG